MPRLSHDMFYKNKNYDEELAPVASQHAGTMTDIHQTTTHDAVFGEISEDGPDYRNVRD